ncbi:MAG: hypothetical protein IPK98_06755 [Chloracidobacterium sp.]|nr:hypothetical protein [Chloracidobacterium sp.]
MPDANAWKVFYERNKQAAYLTDSTKGTTPIYQKIDNLSAAKSAYGNIILRKAFVSTPSRVLSWSGLLSDGCEGLLKEIRISQCRMDGFDK